MIHPKRINNIIKGDSQLDKISKRLDELNIPRCPIKQVDLK
jgi:hypothetical protein